MNDWDIAVVVKTLLGIIKQASPVWITGQRRTRGRVIDGLPFGLVDSSLDDYDRLVDTLLRKHGWHDKYSEEFTRTALDAIIARAVSAGDTEHIAEGVGQLVRDYKTFSQEQTVYVPLAGIQLSLDSLSIGKVELKTMTGDMIQSIADAVAQIIDEGTSAEDVKPSAKERCRRTIHGLQEQVCAEYRVVAEPIRALELALHDTRRVVELIRYAIPAVDDHSPHPKVGIYGEVLPRAVRPAVVLSTDQSRFQLSEKVVGPYVRLRVDAACMARMKEAGVFEVSDLLRKPSRSLTDVEEALLRGIHWIADAVEQPETETEFLSLMTCLETYLTPEDREPIGTAVAEGVAVALVQSLDARKAIKRKVKQLYGKRSALSHGGKQTVLRSDVDALRVLARAMTIWMIRNRGKWHDRQEVLNWVEDQRLGGAVREGTFEDEAACPGA